MVACAAESRTLGVIRNSVLARRRAEGAVGLENSVASP